MAENFPDTGNYVSGITELGGAHIAPIFGWLLEARKDGLQFG
jgi:hypothetical protein